MKVLIAEDEPIILRSIKRGIESFGEAFEVIAIAYDGNEALELMEQEHYDVVITDIVMPLMSGLEMISEARKRGNTAKFVLISGYDKFEFARKAIEIGVAKYLLKPVDFSELKICLEELQKDIEKERRKEEKRYLQELSNKYQDLKAIKEKEFYYIFSIISGCLGRSEYERLPSEAWMAENDFEELLKILEEKYKRNIYYLPGHYPNEKLVVISTESVRWKEASEFAKELYGNLHTKNFFTVCYYNQGISGKDFQKQLTNLHCELPLRIVFGENTLQCLGEKDAVLSWDVTEVLKNAVTKLSVTFTAEEMELYVWKCVNAWKEMRFTQFQLQTEIRYFMEHLLDDRECDTTKFLYERISYDEIKDILFELLMKKIIGDFQKKPTKSDLLAEAMKKYLDEHYTEEINYKDISHIFGYNEKYITTVFKEKTGMSPSRYVSEKRMETAKEILLTEDGILLKEVAERVGYSDPLYFSKVFKNSIGMSPRAFMKKNEEVTRKKNTKNM